MFVRRPGELATVSHDELTLLEEEDIDELDLPKWQAEMIPQLREIALGEDWIALPEIAKEALEARAIPYR